MRKQKILLAVGYKEMEEYLKERLEDEFDFIGEVVYREGIVKNIELKNPDIVIIRETLMGNISILSVINKIRTDYPNTRIIFLAKKRVPGDKLLSLLVSYGVYDILHDQKVIVDELIALIKKPNNYRDVAYLLPSAEIDEATNQVIFNATGDVIKEVVVQGINNKENDNNKITNKRQQDIENIEDENIKEEIESEEREQQSKKTKDKEIENKERLNKVLKTEDRGKKKKESNFNLSKITQTIKKTTKEGFDSFKIQNEEWQKEKEFEKEKKKQQKEKEFLELEKDVEPYMEIKAMSGKKIVTFLGGTRGVGNTVLALNLAMYLATRGEKVIYIELNKNFSAINYWFNFNFKIGTDNALDLVKERKMFDIDKQILTKEYMLKNGDEDYKNNYKKFSSNLDFMTYSKYKDLKDMSKYTPFEYKDLLLYLLFQQPYSYVILDLNIDIDEELLSECLLISGQICTTITQDIKSIGNAVYKLNNLGYGNNKNLLYIVNKYNKKAMLNDKGIKKWLETENVVKISDYKEFMLDSNYVGLPFLSYTKDRAFKKEIAQIIKFL